MAHEGANKTEQEPLLRTPNLEGFGALQEPSDLTEVYHTGRDKGEAWFKLVGSEKVLFVEGTLGSPHCCLLWRMAVGHSRLASVGHPLVASKCENGS